MFTSRLFGGTPTTSSPRRRISPRSGSSKPATILIVVVFPQPEGPRSVMNSPSWMSSETSLTAVTLPNVFVTSWMLIAGVATSLIAGSSLATPKGGLELVRGHPGLRLQPPVGDPAGDLGRGDDDHGDGHDHDGHGDHLRQTVRKAELRIQVDRERRRL